MQPTQRFKLTDKQLSTTLSGETVILNHQDGVYYNLDEVGTFIWEKLRENPATIDELKMAVLNEYDVEENDCEADINRILTELQREKLVETVA